MTVQQRLTGKDYPLKLSAREFLALADAGLFEAYTRTELIEGEVWTLNAVHRWHARMQVDFAFAIKIALGRIGSSLVLYAAGSVLMSDDSVPEPDISVGQVEPLSREPISLAAIRMAVELSDATRAMDLGRKAILYARCGVPEYWVADRDKQLVVRHGGPSDQGYREIEASPFGEPVAALTVAGLTVDTSCLLG